MRSSHTTRCTISSNWSERLILSTRLSSQDGHFVSCDMIGRNGHMRWPETLRYVEAIWANLPEVKKYNWQLREYHHQFLNWDCSREGFEGIRAQDILPQLLQRFSFDGFVGSGGFIDPFVDRGYGPNYDAANALDRDFIDLVATANDAMIDAAQIKPTMMFADMVKKNSGVKPRVVGWRNSGVLRAVSLTVDDDGPPVSGVWTNYGHSKEPTTQLLSPTSFS